MSIPDESLTTLPTESNTKQGRAFLAAYRALDEVDRVTIWRGQLTELERCWRPPAEVPPPRP